MPGGWYLIAELLDDDDLDLDVVVHSDNLELIPTSEESEYTQKSSDLSTLNGQAKNMNLSPSK